jgi:translocation and assembly module TamA
MHLKTRWGNFRRFLVTTGAVASLVLIPAVAFALETSLSAPGAPEALQNRLRAASSVLSADSRGLTTSQELLAAALSDYGTLVQVLYDAGYFSPVVNIRLNGREAADIAPLDPPRSVRRIDISVATGRAFRFGVARVGPLAPDTGIPEGFRAGRPAGTGIIRDAASAGVAGWRQAGYAKAELGAQRITANHQTATLDADLQLLPGRRLTFGTLSTTTPSAVRADAIAAIAGFPAGKVYDPDLVQKVATRLRRTGAFASVSLNEAEQANADGSLDFRAAVADMPQRRISFGIELSSRNGMDLSAKWIHRNLFGAAERLQIEGRLRNLGGVEDVDGVLSFRLDRPATLGPDDNMFYLGAIEQLNEPHYSLNMAMLGIGARRYISDDLFSEVALTGSTNASDDAFGKRQFQLLALPWRTQLDKRDNKVSATRGFFIDTMVTPFTGFGGTESGLSALVDGRGYLSLSPSGSVVLAGRVVVGSVLGASLPDISPDYLFYSGGAGSVRGQPYQSLGVPVGTKTAGGRSILVMSAEIRGRVSEKLSIVGFFDAGAVDASSFVDTNSPAHSGAGLGVRYDLGGFGPLRLDLALPVDGTTGSGLQFYLGIGQAF